MSLTVEKLRGDINVLAIRRDQAHQNYHQVIGAISILEQMIYHIEHPEEAKPEGEEECEVEPVPEHSEAA
jgi:hypothetical protein